MTKNEIVDRLARERCVEKMIANISKTPLDQDLQDLAQIVYLIILLYDEAKILDLWEHNEIRYFIARVVITQMRAKRSAFDIAIKRFQRLTVPLIDKDQDPE